MAKLIVHDLDRTYLVDLRPGERLTLGRSQDCDLPVQAPRASRRHLEIGPTEGPAAVHGVRDLDSTNGTTLNGAPFPDQAPLADGDIIRAGGCEIHYRSQA